MSEFKIIPATRAGLKPLVGFYGKSSSGKTMSALLFARGLVGPTGKIVMIDSENERGKIFSDIIPGGYSVIDLGEPFTPERYSEAIDVAEKDADVVVIDSFTHEWAGEGGILDMQEAELQRMAGDNYQRRESCKMASWIKPKMAHKKLVGRILRCKCALIVCLRGEEKTHMDKRNGKNVVITDDFSSPIQDPRFIFEMLVNFETLSRDGVGGYVIPRKVTHPAIKEFLPGQDDQIGEKHGKLIGQWCATPAKPPEKARTAPVERSEPPAEGPDTPTDRKSLLLALRAATAPIHGWLEGQSEPSEWVPAKKTMIQWLYDEGVLDPSEETLDNITDKRLALVIKKAKEKISDV